ncbi:MAG: primosomal protein N', partial [Deltaproteobacteria bacterium]|nr:primosomal protein N' [Deltaproteobacteria bacterium]
AICRDCGFVYTCPNCSVSLIYHLADKTFRCHYCDHSLPGLDRCPQCASTQVTLFGMGTQRLEQEIKKRLPHVQVGRMDRDTMSRKSAQQRILSQVRKGEINLLVGTQMITKGHDLPRVTLVGVLAADLSLNFPDFRASERTFQLLTQVAGRAGRGTLPGRVIIQTYNPDHYSIQLAREQDFPGFYRKEAEFRKEMDYPPFSRLICLRIEGNSEGQTMKWASTLEEITRKLLPQEKTYREMVEVLGPTPAPMAKIKGKFRLQMLLKGKRWDVLHDFAERFLAAAEDVAMPGIKLTVDVDPVNML